MPSSSRDAVGTSSVHLDFERGTFEGWNASRLAGAHSARVVDDVARTGRRSCRFELRPGDYVSQGHRAELRDPFNALWEGEVWYGFSSRLAEDFDLGEGGCVLAQWHDQAKLGDPSGKPPLALRLRGARLILTGAYGRVAGPDPDIRYEFGTLGDMTRGAWTDFVFRVHWSQHGDSEIEAWRDGDRFITWRGPLAYENEVKGPYLKLGLYWSPPGPKPIVAWHDNYSRGQTYTDVDPSLPHGVSNV